VGKRDQIGGSAGLGTLEVETVLGLIGQNGIGSRLAGVWDGVHMDLVSWLASTKTDAERIAELSRGDLSARVPPCPDWNLGDLVEHVGRVFQMVTHALTTGSRPEQLAERPAGVAVADWYRGSVDGVLAAFETADPEAEVWNWSVGPQLASFWWRRMAQESAIHRWDAESAVGTPSAVDRLLASDGIDEWFDVHLRSDLQDPDFEVPDGVGTLHVHCGDVDGEWWAELDGRELVLERAHRKGDVVARGGASDLLLMLWGRQSIDAVEVLGEASKLGAWIALPDG
jgi:uncharacterized protein (TIGR03083 family)